jgi:hypothetical protein
MFARAVITTVVQYGVELDVPAATILSMFGLEAQVWALYASSDGRLICLAQSFWWPDTGSLGIFIGVFTVASYFLLHYYVRESR